MGFDHDPPTITVRSSYDTDTTEGEHAAVIAVAEPLKLFLREVLLASRGLYVCCSPTPTPRGKMPTNESDLVLRHALAWSTATTTPVGDGNGAPHVEHHDDAARRTVPPLRPRALAEADASDDPVPRPARNDGHAARHGERDASGGAGVLRQSDPRITANFYTRVDLADQRAGLNRIAIRRFRRSLRTPHPLVPVVSPDPDDGSAREKR